MEPCEDSTVAKEESDRANFTGQSNYTDSGISVKGRVAELYRRILSSPPLAADELSNQANL